MAAIDSVAPYLEQVLDNDDVRDNLRRARVRAQQAYGSTKRKGAKKAAGDRKVRARVVQSAIATRDAALAVRRGREQEVRRQQRRTRLRRVLVLLVLAGGAALAADEGLRRQVLDLAGAGNGAAPSTDGDRATV